MKTSVSHLSRWFLVVLLQVVCVIALSAQGAGGFRVYREWNFSLDYEQCRELVMAGLAVLEQENSKLCRYIDTEVSPQIVRSVFEMENGMDNGLFKGIASGSSYYRILFFSKDEYVHRFEDGFVAMVYLLTDGTPFGLKTGYRSNKDYNGIEIEKPLKLKNVSLMPKQLEVPSGFPELNDEERMQIVKKAMDAAKKHVGGSFSILNVDGVPVVIRMNIYGSDGVPQEANRAILVSRGVFVYVTMWKDSGKIVDISMDSTHI